MTQSQPETSRLQMAETETWPIRADARVGPSTDYRKIQERNPLPGRAPCASDIGGYPVTPRVAPQANM